MFGAEFVEGSYFQNSKAKWAGGEKLRAGAFFSKRGVILAVLAVVWMAAGAVSAPRGRAVTHGKTGRSFGRAKTAHINSSSGKAEKNNLSHSTGVTYSGGSGTAEDPYLISTPEDLNAVGAEPNDWGKHFKLMADIDLSAYTGTEFNIIGNESNAFRGVFDGNNHTISNFTYDSSEVNCVGLFGYIHHDGEVKKLGLIDPNVESGTGNYTGALVGLVDHGSIKRCYVENGSVSGTSCVGGLVGKKYDREGNISNCYSTASVTGDDKVGGLVGTNEGGVISNCYSKGDVTGTSLVGGLVGENYSMGAYILADGTISNCYSAGSVSGDSHVGGLLGKNSVTASGRNSGTVIVSYWDVNSSGEPNSAGGSGKTTAQMKSAETFVGWGCDSVWTIDEGNNYPRLAWENKPGELITNPSYWAGSGTEEDPYLVYTANELNMIGLIVCEWDKQFKLMADIDLSGFTETNFNTIGHQGSPFTGVFDGNGHTISNFTYSCGDIAEIKIGLFKQVDGPNAEIKNVIMIDPNVNADAGDAVGSLVGYLRSGVITDCYVEGGSVRGDFAGGLVGYSSFYGTISNCHSSCDVSGNRSIGGLAGMIGTFDEISNCSSSGVISGDSHAGGLIGELLNGTVNNCYSSGSVSGWSYIGGLMGTSTYGVVTDSYSTASVSGTGGYVGGLAGKTFFGRIRYCYATSEISGNDKVGGLVGYNYGTVDNCYSTGSVSGITEVGGLVGKNYRAISNCYSSGSVSGTTDTGGLVGWDYDLKSDYTVCFWDSDVNPDLNGIGNVTNPNVIGETTTNMQTESTFTDAGWDFVGESINGSNDIWTIWEGVDYPRLEWQNSLSGDFNIDNVWMYQNLPGQTFSDLTASVSITGDPMGNGSYSYEWEFVLPSDVTILPATVAGGGAGDAFLTFASASCNEPNGISDSGQTFTVRVTVTGDDYGNSGTAEIQFAIALLGDINNNTVVDVADRSIANAFWRTGSAGAFSLRDCDLNYNGIVDVADRSIVNAIWRGTLGQDTVSNPCPLR